MSELIQPPKPGVYPDITDGRNIKPDWQNRFERWAENNADRLIEEAQYEMESRWEARRSVDYDAWKERKMDGVI